MGEGSAPVALAVLALVALALALVAAVVLLKSRRFRGGDVFVASRLTRGNRLFPTQVAIAANSVVQCKPQWLGREEQSIHIGHVASVTIDTGLLFSNVVIETSGGSEPIVCHGHAKSDAVRMKELIERYQSEQVAMRPLAGPTAAGAGLPLDHATGATRACPFCAETIKAAAVVCRYCGRDLPPGRAGGG